MFSRTMGNRTYLSVIGSELCNSDNYFPGIGEESRYSQDNQLQPEEQDSTLQDRSKKKEEICCW